MNFYSTLRVLLAVFFVLHFTAVDAASQDSVAQKLAALETSFDGLLGISAVDISNGQRIEYHADERFPTGSTFKALGVGAVLKQSMSDPQLLQQTMMIEKQDLRSWCPVAEKHVGHAMSVFDLSAAAIMYSDNAAIYLLMEKLGGPEKVVGFARSIGDDSFRMNTNLNDLNPSSTPAAMEKTLEKLSLGDILAAPQRNQLITWMKNNTTGNARIRAGVPKAWVVADKTGSGPYGLTNDMAIIWPPNCQPIVVVIYFIQKKKDATARPWVVAKATKMILDELGEKKGSCLQKALIKK